MRNPIADAIIHGKCGGVKNYATMTGQPEQSARNHLSRGFPGSKAHNEIFCQLKKAGVDITPEDFFTQPTKTKKGTNHGTSTEE